MIESMSVAAIRREWVGSLVGGKFPLVRWFGGSESAGVFLTNRNEPDVPAIIKLIPADADGADARAAAWEAATTLSHPNVMQVYEHGRCEIDGVQCLYVVTEFADEVLAEILKERPLTLEETRDLLGPALDALSYLHGKGLVHARLRPANIMAAGDRLKLSADSLSFVGAPISPSTAHTGYDAPELADGVVLPAADLWSLGATLVEALTQRPPQWDGLENSEPMVPQSVPQPFAAIARRCLRTDPARRGTIEAMQLRLAPVKASTEPEPKRPKTPPTNRRTGPLVAFAAVLLVVIGIWIALAHRKQPTAPPQQAQAQPANAPAQASAQLPPSQANPAAAEPPAATQPVALDATPPAQAPAATIPPATATPPPTQTQIDETPAPAATAINPAIMSQILPDILPSAMKTINGTLRVSVELTVGADGNVTDATLASPGPSKYFAGKSLEAARHWKFRPTQAGNWTLEFQYTRGGIHVVAEPAAP